jgi:hypothetical protein
MPTPQDNMTVKQLAQFFHVDHTSYHRWMTLFSPFGTDSNGKAESMKLTPIGKKKNPTRFILGTDIPVPIGNKSFAGMSPTTTTTSSSSRSSSNK